ncbi:ribosomal eL19 family protein [Paraburkholderia sediminicola]|uniref:hypothetical protein n=1 Tax=Paraburkholderia sediminicola TaxID=458836 RepID=UPI0038B79714
MKPLLSFQGLDYASDFLNEICHERGLQPNFCREVFLSDAESGAVLLSVVLPGPFHYQRKNRQPIPPGQFFPKGAEFFYVDEATAYQLILAEGASVDLTRLKNYRPDGQTDEFTAFEPALKIAVKDLRVSRDELSKYVRKLPAVSAVTPTNAGAGESCKPSHVTSPNGKAVAYDANTRGDAVERVSDQTTDCAPPDAPANGNNWRADAQAIADALPVNADASRAVAQLPNVNAVRETDDESAQPAKPAANVTEAATNPVLHSLKSRWNALDTAIEKAIKSARSDKTSDVLQALRNMALEEYSPFNGKTEGSALFYTNDEGQLANLTKDALDGRLRRRRNRR